MKITEKDKDRPKEKRQRSVNFSCKETELLVDIVVNKYGNIIENKQTDAVTWDQKRQAWEKIYREFNAVSGATNRTVKTLQIKYEGLKRALRKKKARNNFETYKKTGGGDAVCIPYTEYEEKLLGVLALSVEGLPSRNDSDDNNNSRLEVCKEANISRNDFNRNSQKDQAVVNTGTLDKENNMNQENVDMEVLDIENMAIEIWDGYTQPKNIEIENEISEEKSENVDETESSNATDPLPGSSTDRSKRWSNKLKKPVNPKLLLPKKKKDNDKSTINEKYSSLADQRRELIAVQIAVAKKELELKQKEIDFVEARSERDYVEHQKRMQLLDLQIMNCSK